MFRVAWCCVVALVLLTARAQIVHFGSENAGIVSASDANGASWLISVRGTSAVLPTQADISDLYDRIVAPAALGGRCELSGSFTARAVRLALVCPADANVLDALVGSLGNACSACTVTSEENTDVDLHSVRRVVLDESARPGRVKITAVRPGAGVRISSTTQSNVRWGLDRSDSRALAYDNEYTYDNDCSGSDVWIIDTGARCTHDELTGRCTWRGNTIDAQNEDCNYHGTHVAGIVGGKTYGVCKNIQIYIVKALDCHGAGTVFTVMAALDLVASLRSPTRSTIINLSLNAGKSSSLDAEVSELITGEGIAVAVAAGNSNDDACKYSPSGAPNVLAVLATDSSDSLALDFSNDGPCARLGAPGVAVISSYGSSDTAVASMDGSSMASPHGAAFIALEWSLMANKQDALGVIANVIARATPGVIKNARRLPVPPLGYARLVSVSPPPPPPPPPKKSPPPGAPLSNDPAFSSPNNGTQTVAEALGVHFAAVLFLFFWFFA